MSDFWNSVGQVLTGIVIGLLAFVASKIQNWIQNKSESVCINKNLMLRQLLAEIRSYYDADRVQLYQFHNGNSFISGVSIQKVSLTHFVSARGVAVQIGGVSLQNIPMGYLLQTIDHLLKNNYFYIDSNEMKEDSYFKGLMRYSGAKCALCRAVFNIKHEIIGFLVVSWFEDVMLTDVQKAAIKDFGTVLSDELLLGNK